MHNLRSIIMKNGPVETGPRSVFQGSTGSFPVVSSALDNGDHSALDQATHTLASESVRYPRPSVISSIGEQVALEASLAPSAGSDSTRSSNTSALLASNQVESSAAGASSQQLKRPAAKAKASNSQVARRPDGHQLDSQHQVAT